MNEDHPISLLVIEDDEDVRDVMEMGLERQGFCVVSCADAAKAFTHLASTQFDVIATDLGLAELGGQELIRELNRRHSCPVVVLTGNGSAREDAMRAGAADFLVKPVSLSEFAERVRQLLHRN